MSLFKFVHSDSTKLEGNLREIMTFSRGSTSEAKNSFVSIYCFSSGEKRRRLENAVFEGGEYANEAEAQVKTVSMR